MKLVIKSFFSLLILLFSKEVDAQKIALGLQGGLSAGGYCLNTTSTSVSTNRNFWVFGVNASYFLNEKFYLTAGINYDSKGIMDRTPIGDLIVKLNYLGLPVTGTYRLKMKDKNYGVDLFAGFQLDYAPSYYYQQPEYSLSTPSNPVYIQVNSSDFSKISYSDLSGNLLTKTQFDFQVKGGFGLFYKLNFGEVRMDYSYGRGILNQAMPKDATMYSNNHNLLLGFRYYVK
jgi:hypothetical protein